MLGFALCAAAVDSCFIGMKLSQEGSTAFTCFRNHALFGSAGRPVQNRLHGNCMKEAHELGGIVECARERAVRKEAFWRNAEILQLAGFPPRTQKH